jgi:serine/threonine protein kinase
MAANGSELMNQETATIKDYLTRVASTPGGEAKAAIISEMFTFLSTSQALLSNDGFRKTVISKIQEFDSEPPEIKAIYRFSLLQLCDTLSKYGEKVPGCPRLNSIFIANVEQANELNKYFKSVVKKDYLFSNHEFIRTIENKIGELHHSAKPEINAIMNDSLELLCDKLREKELIIYLPGCPKINLPELTVVGKGGYGAVFKPALPNRVNGELKSFPDNVTKAFYSKSNYRKLIEKIPRIRNVMGENDGHRINTYTRKYKAYNLPEKILKELDVASMSNIHFIRMPDLGNDILHIGKYKTKLHRIHFRTILTQIQKLIGQTTRLAERGYGHFDIRDTNIMIKPETGIMTIIDFDWFSPLRELYEGLFDFSFYNMPPESLLKKKFDEVLALPPENDDRIHEFVNEGEFSKYTSHVLKYFGDAESKYFNMNNKDEFKHAVIEANKDNVAYLRSQLPAYENSSKELFLRRAMPTFDNYGLGLTMLQMCAIVYYIDGQNKEAAITGLSELLTDNGRRYIDAELNVIVDALFAVIALLKRMSLFRLRDRILPADAKTEIDRIVATFNAVYPAILENVGARRPRGRRTTRKGRRS